MILDSRVSVNENQVHQFVYAPGYFLPRTLVEWVASRAPDAAQGALRESWWADVSRGMTVMGPSLREANRWKRHYLLMKTRGSRNC